MTVGEFLGLVPIKRLVSQLGAPFPLFLTKIGVDYNCCYLIFSYSQEELLPLHNGQVERYSSLLRLGRPSGLLQLDVPLKRTLTLGRIPIFWPYPRRDGNGLKSGGVNRSKPYPSVPTVGPTDSGAGRTRRVISSEMQIARLI